MVTVVWRICVGCGTETSRIPGSQLLRYLSTREVVQG